MSIALQQGVGRAHAKAILIGEHAVVHGSPAIALPLPDLGATVYSRETPGPGTIDSTLFTGSWDEAPEALHPLLAATRAVLRLHGRPEAQLELQIRSDIPTERGLGSSAAVAAAAVEAILQSLGHNEFDAAARHELIQTAERVAHGTPSGLDAHAVTAAGPIWFEHGQAEALDVARRLTFVVADTGSPGATSQAVSAVHAQRDQDAARVDRIIGRIADTAHATRNSIAAGNVQSLGAQLNDAHALLQDLTVSNAELDHLVQVARDGGAVGAKLTGGGYGGCIIALAPNDLAEPELSTILRQNGAKATWALTVEATS